jgi:hypothetical protein
VAQKALPGQRPLRQPGAIAKRLQPRELLENRCVPSTITPTTLADSGLGSGSLRDAVLQFNADTRTDDDIILLDRVIQIVNPGTQVVFQDLVIQGGLAQDDGSDGALAGTTWLASMIVSLSPDEPASWMIQRWLVWVRFRSPVEAARFVMSAGVADGQAVGAW